MTMPDKFTLLMGVKTVEVVLCTEKTNRRQMKQLLKLTTFLLFAQLSQLQAQTSIVQPAGRKT
jgi:hypothetical protein